MGKIISTLHNTTGDDSLIITSSSSSSSSPRIIISPVVAVMGKFVAITLLLLAAVATTTASSSSCTIKTTSGYTTTDASILTSIAYVALMETVGCPGVGENLYAEVSPSAQLLQLSRSPSAPTTLQLSWTEDTAKATKGDHTINIINEETYNQIRKAAKAGSAPPTITPLATTTLNHPGAYNGPWLNSEHLAAILGIGVTYIAVSQRAKLVA